MTEHIKFFSLEEANQSLIYLRPVAQDIINTYSAIVSVRDQMGDQEGEPGPGHQNEDSEIKAEYERLMDRLSDLVDEAHNAGVVIVDFEKGILHFPFKAGFKEVHLKWAPVQKFIGFWNDPDVDYFTAWRPLEELGINPLDHNLSPADRPGSPSQG